MDGSKFICLDNLYLDLKNKRCLIYSFGLSTDWTFEESLAAMGCQVILENNYLIGNSTNYRSI